jgi:predicted SprT family Zn-dependent metalloprotease
MRKSKLLHNKDWNATDVLYRCAKCNIGKISSKVGRHMINGQSQYICNDCFKGRGK